MSRINNKNWGHYKNVIQKFLSEDSGLKPIIWLRKLSQPLPFGEDVGSSYFQETLNVLVGYNVYRTWPINKVTPSGEMDEETCYIIIPNDYLDERGLIQDGRFNIDITLDRFIINGQVYKSSGDTQAAQASEQDIVSMVILKRINSETIDNYTIITQP